jgi:sugar phosphate permease
MEPAASRPGSAMIDLTFLRVHARWLSAGLLLSFASSFGQTYFIALFGGQLRTTFALSHGDFGSLYTIATLGSAATLVWLGQFADRMRVQLLGALTLCGLATASLAMAGVTSPLMLVAVLYGLRLFGQGMLSHLAMTAMARWFSDYRGRALSIAALGFPFGEALLPSVAVALMAVLGWRQTWLAAAGLLLVVAVPLIGWLLRNEPAPCSGMPARAPSSGPAADRRQWTRGEVVRDPLFYALMPGMLAPSFITTGIFFHQVYLAETKGWTLSWFAACYPVYAVATVAVSLVVGWAVDRWGAARLLPFYLLPMAAALLVLAWVDAPAGTIAFMLLAGGTSGGAVTLLGALWAELYGTRHLGAIRALAVAGMVFSSALGPGVMGWLIDGGINLEHQFLVMAVYTVVSAGLFRLLSPRLRYLTAA